ncbi:MAG TPA: FtsX-like permease family protein, partial [Puia sp.]
DADFLSMFTYPVVKGQGADALAELTDAVVTEETAKKIFGNEDPIGKHIRVSVAGGQQDLVVTSVVKDPVATSVRFQILTRIENSSNYAKQGNHWDDNYSNLYVELKAGASQRQAEGQLRDVDHKHVPMRYADLQKKGAKPDALGDLWATRLLPMKDVHFDTVVNGGRAVSVAQLLITMSVGLFIILIACFNFVNISLAGAFTRSREVGVRKCLGAARWKLFVQLWGESLLVCMVAYSLSLVLVYVLLHSIAGLQQLRVPIEAILWQPRFIGLLLGLLLFVSLMAGGYPALVMIRFKAVETLKGKVSMGRKSALRSSLIVLQFVIACVMISCTLIMYRQYQYLTHADLGMAKEGMISVPLHAPDKGHATIAKLRLRLSADPRIVSVSGSNINLGRGSDHRTVHSTTGFTYEARDISTQMASVDYDYLKTLGVKLLGGREFDPAYGTDTANNVIINESMAKQLIGGGRAALPASLVGKNIILDTANNQAWHIVGVFPDYHLYNMGERVEPLTLTLRAGESIPYVFVKTSGKDMVGAMAAIKREMASLEPGQDFNGSFVEDNVKDWYIQEQTMSFMFSIAAMIAIVLSCSGLLAMVLLMIKQRVKEIGVRKVLGASVANISLLVSKEFVLLVALAVVIATPIAWVAMHAWISGYPYRVNITIWNFLLVGVFAVGIALVTIAWNTVRAARQNPVRALRSE